MERISQLTSSQNGVYFENYQQPGSRMYNITMCYIFGKSLDAGKLFEAVKKVCSSYEVFATTIRNIDGSFYNVVNEEKRQDYIHERVKFHKVSEAEIEKIKKTCIHSFALEDSPLYFIDIYESEKAVYLFTDIHHAIWDGTSNVLFLSAINSVYENGSLSPELISLADLYTDEEKLFSEGKKDADFEFFD